MVLSWSYNAGTNTATVSGAGSTTAFFTDLVSADTAGGWGIYTADATGTQIICSGKIIIGDAATASTCSDTLKHVTFTDGSTAAWGHLITVKGASSLTLGTLVDATDKTTKNGCIITSLDADNNHYIIGNSYSAGTAKVYLYDTKITSVATTFIAPTAGTFDLRIYNCQFDGCHFESLQSSSDLYNVNMANCGEAILGCLGTMDRINIYGSANVYFATTTQSILKNIWMRSNTRAFRCWGITVDQDIINGDFDSWATQWGDVCTAVVNRKYEVDLLVQDTAGAAVGTATCVLKDKNGTQIFSVNTDALGVIATQTVSKSYFDQAHGDTEQEYGPHTLTVTKAGYQTYTQVFTLTEKTDWTITLLDEVPAPDSSGRTWGTTKHDIVTVTKKDPLTEPALMATAALLVENQMLRAKRRNRMRREICRQETRVKPQTTS